MPTPVPPNADSPSMNPFVWVVRQRVRHSFAALSRQDPSAALALMGDDVQYSFDTPTARHALAGTRHTKAAVEQWFARLLRLLPGQFNIQSVEVSGWPWLAQVKVRFEDRVTPQFGPPYTNQGQQDVELRWGRAVHIHTQVETVKIQAALDHLVRHGVTEAAAPPIEEIGRAHV